MDNSRFADVNGEFTITAADNTGYSLVFYCGTIGIVNTFGSVLAEFDADDIPAADVAPVVHGEWVEGAENFTNGRYDAECNRCGTYISWNAGNSGDWNFCPNCGAKMDGGKK